MIITDATEADLPAILDIHNDAVLNTTAVWWFHAADLASRRNLLAERQAKAYPFLVAKSDADVLGYATFGEFRPQDGFCKTVEHSIYVARPHRRRGVARALLPPLIGRARAIGKHAMIGGIDATNEASIKLHEAFGFAIVGRLPQVGFKFGRYLDLVFLQKLLDEP